MMQREGAVPSSLVILTGASGVGKTTIARAVRRLHPEIPVFLQEELAKPGEDFMRGIGPTEGAGGPLQRGFALHWIPQLMAMQATAGRVLLECQCRISFLEEALGCCPKLDPDFGARILLMECEDATREERLRGRGSPELVHEQMRGWSRYLHAEAVAAGIAVVDTGAAALEGNVARVLSYFKG